MNADEEEEHIPCHDVDVLNLFLFLPIGTVTACTWGKIAEHTPTA